MTTPGPMLLDPAEVQIGTANGPGIWLAPAGTPGPATVDDDWAAPWKSLGYLSDDGPTIGQSTDSEDITPWQSITPIRTVVTSRGVTLQFVMWQLNPDTLALYFDTDVPDTGAAGDISMQIRTDAPQHVYAVGIDSRDAERVLRVTFPRASLSDAGDMQIQRGAAVPLDVTLSALDYGGVLADILVGKLSVTGAAADLSRSAVRNRGGGSGNGGGHAPAPSTHDQS